MKILFICNYKNFGGWADAAIFNIRELISLGHSVTVRHINVGSGCRYVTDIDILQKPLDNFDIVIEHTLPSIAYRDYRITSLICYYTESDSIPQNWVEKINSFDGAIVSCESSKQASLRSGVKVPIHVNPIPIRRPPTVQPAIIKRNPNACLFYTIADCNPRKNLQALLMAFHSEFRKEDQVELVIKVSDPQEQAHQYINSLSQQIKEGLRLYPSTEHYIKETIIYGYASEEQLASVHHAGDVFYITSYGESFSIPTMEAALLGKYIVAPKHSCFNDYLSDYDGAWLVTSYETPCFGANAPQDLHTAAQNWWKVDIDELRYGLRWAYTNWKRKETSVNSIKIESKWSEIIEE